MNAATEGTGTSGTFICTIRSLFYAIIPGQYKMELKKKNIGKFIWIISVDGLVQERRNSHALAMEIHLSCTNPSTWTVGPWYVWREMQDELLKSSFGARSIWFSYTSGCEYLHK